MYAVKCAIQELRSVKKKTSGNSKKRPGTGGSSSILLRMQEVQKIQPTKKPNKKNKIKANKNTPPKKQPKKGKTQPNKNLTLAEEEKKENYTHFVSSSQA